MQIINHLFSDAFIYAFGWTVVHALWQVTLIAFLVAIALLVQRGQSAKMRYWTAVLGLFAVLVSAIATFCYLYAGTDVGLVFESVEVVPKVLTGLTAEAVSVQDWQLVFSDYFNEHLPIIVTLWLLGASIFALRLLGGLIYIQRLRYGIQRPLDTKWYQLLEDLAMQLPVQKTIKLAESALVKVPLVIGHLKPVILFPIGVVNELSIKEVEAILAHELAHIYRHDYLVNIFQSIIETLFYYHPAIWWLSWIIQTEREHCCDDLAVQLSGNSMNYAKALVRLQEMHQPAPGFAMPFAGQKNQLLNRIQRILNHPQNESNFMEKLIATAMLTFAVLMLSVSARTPFVNLKNAVAEILDEKTEACPEEVVIPSITTIRNHPIVLKAPEIVMPEWNRKLMDTLPPLPSGKYNYSYSRNGREIKLESEGGKIIYLEIDGEIIDKADYEKYEQLLTEIMKPTYPMPPSFDLPVPPSPPAPPSPFSAPSPPVPAPFWGKKKSNKISRERGEDGNAVIIIQSDDQKDPIRISIKDGDEPVIVIDGKELKEGESAVIGEDEFSFWNFDEDAPVIIGGKSKFPRGFYIDKDGLRSLNEFLEKHKESFEKSSKEWEKEMEDYLHNLNGYRLFYLDKARSDAWKQLLKAQEMQNLALDKERLLEPMLERVESAIEKSKQKMLEVEERQKEILDRAFEIKERYEKGKETILQQMIKDGLVKEGEKVSFKINPNKLIINGKKQSKAVHKKYKQLYEDAMGSPLESDYDIKFKIDPKKRML